MQYTIARIIVLSICGLIQVILVAVGSLSLLSTAVTIWPGSESALRFLAVLLPFLSLVWPIFLLRTGVQRQPSRYEESALR